MRESTSTSNFAGNATSALALRLRPWLFVTLLLGLMTLAVFFPLGAHAADSNDRSLQPEEEDFSTTPYTQYGEYDEQGDEDDTIRFLQHGRLFGISLGLGLESADGNRGTLWQGGFPLVDARIHYWFDFNFAMDLALYYVHHYYDTTEQGHTNVSMMRVGLDLKYYFDTKNLSAPISFANPFIVAGVAAYTKSESNVQNASTTDTDTEPGISVGAGLEFALVPR